MPLYRGSCGCYNKEDARELGLSAAVVWNDVMDKSECFGINPFWYDQKQAAERLGLSESTLKRAVDKLVEAGRISKRKGYRPGTTISTTWITIYAEEVEGDDTSRKSGLTLPMKSDLTLPILKETKEKRPKAGGSESEFRNTQSTHSPLVVYIRVNPSGRKWKSKKVYSNQEEIDKLDSVDDDERIEFKYWLSPKMVGDYDRVKHTFCKAKLIQPDVDDEEEDSSEEVSVW